MPLRRCEEDGKPGWQWGSAASAKCYTYTADDEDSEKGAKKKAIKQALAIGGGKPPEPIKTMEERRLFAEASGALETVDLDGVDIMAADVRVFGEGAVPAEGEVYTVEALERIAADSNEIADELRPPNKLGHSLKQRLLAASGFLDEEERPAAGWLTNFRVEGAKLYADIKRVPKKVADLIEAGAFRVRSPEIGPYVSQGEESKTYSAVVRGLAWLGESAPAFKTLDDVHALFSGADRSPSTVELIYADRELEEKDLAAAAYYAEDATTVLSGAGGSSGSHAPARIVWEPDDSAQSIMDKLRRSLNPGPGIESRYWVMDVSADRTRALVQDYSEGSQAAYVVPITVTGGHVEAAPGSDWILAEQAWVERASEIAYREPPEAARARGDTTQRMAEDTGTKTPPEGETADELTGDEVGVLRRLAGIFKPKDGDDPELKLDPEAIKAFAEAAGVPDETDPAKILAAVGEQKEKAAEPPKPEVPEGMKLMQAAELDELKALAQKGADADAKINESERVAYFREQTRVGRLDPADYEHYKKVYDENPEFARSVIEKLPQRAEIAVAALGAEGDEGHEVSGMDEDQYRAYCEATGIPYDAQREAVAS